MVFKQKVILIIFIIIGTILQVLPVIKSGLKYEYGYGFWGPNGHDGIWHLSLINHISNPLKIDMPTFSGSTLVNYHPFFDIVISFLSKVSFTPASIWLFQIFPILSAILLLYLSFYLGRLVTKSYLGGIILLGLNTTANSFGWIISYLKDKSLGGESIFWAMQSPSNQINPPFNFSLILIMLCLIILFQHNLKKSFSKKHSLIIFIILSLLPVTKAYSAIIGFGVLGILALISLVKYQQKSLTLTFIISLISSIAIFSIYNPKSGSLFVYKPFWFINSMIESPDRIFIPFLANMRYTLESSGNIGPRLIILWLLTFGLFILGNFAWRLLGIIQVIKKPNYINLTLLFLIIVQITIPTLFIQKGTSWNTIQFLYYAMFLGNILLSQYLVSQKGIVQKILLVIIFSSNLIGLFGMLPNYLGKTPPAMVSNSEINALKYLSNLPSGVVLTAPYDQYLKSSFKQTPIPIYAYETTSYVSAYSKKSTFVDDYMNLSNSGYDHLSRLKSSTDFFNQTNVFQDRGFLLNNNISYIYLTGLQLSKYPLNEANLYLKTVYDEQETVIYQVLK